LARGKYGSPEEVIEYALESLEETERPSQPQARANPEEFRAFLDALAEGSENIPTLPSSAFSRESIYQDHP
jgi:hypothetical protein